MINENVILVFRLKNIEEIRNYLLEEIKNNNLMTENNKKMCRVLTLFRMSLFGAAHGWGW